MKKTLLILLIALAASGCVKKETPRTPEQIRADQTVPNATPPVSDDSAVTVGKFVNREVVIPSSPAVAGWTLYTNLKQGYEIAIPSDWTFVNKDDLVVNNPEDQETYQDIQAGKVWGEGFQATLAVNYFDSLKDLTKNENQSYKSLKDYFDNSPEVIKYQPIKIAGVSGWITQEGGFGTYQVIYLEHNNHIFQFFADDERIDKAHFTEGFYKQILSTFKFTK